MRHSKRLAIYKVLILVFIIAIIVWPRILVQGAEIDTMALAVAIGIDVNNDDDRGQILASAQIIVPVPQGQQSGRQEVFFGTGKTLSEALSYVNVKIGRIVDFGQVGIIIFGEEKAKLGVVNELKYLINNKVRPESTLFVAHNSEARELLKKANNLTEEATSSLNNLLKFNAHGTHMPNINLLEFLSDSNITDRTSYIPILNIESQDTIALSDGTSKKENGGLSIAANAQEKSNSEDSKNLNEIKDVDRVFLFKDGKIADKLNKDENKGLIWNNKDSHIGLIVAENVFVGGHKIEYLPCKLRAKSVTCKANFESGKPVLTYFFNLKFHIEDLHEINELRGENLKITKTEINDSIKKSLQDIIKRDMDLCIKKLRESNIDALRIRRQFFKFKYRKYINYINNNSNFLNNTEIRYNFCIKIY